MTNEMIVKYQTMTGKQVTLSPAIIRKYLVSGDGVITDQEIMMFLALCKYQNLNPFLREAYLIKYGKERATIVVGKETFLKRAVKNPKYRGHKTGISEDGNTAWAEVYVEGYQTPIRCEVDYDEYVGRTKDGVVNKIWRIKKKTLLKKVALVQSLREAFPEDFGGMYSPEEISIIQTDLPDKSIELPDNEIDFIPDSSPQESDVGLPPRQETSTPQEAPPLPQPQGGTSPFNKLVEKIELTMTAVSLNNLLKTFEWVIKEITVEEKAKIDKLVSKKREEFKGR